MRHDRHLLRTAWLWALLYSFVHLLADLLQRRLNLPDVLAPFVALMFTILLVFYCIQLDLCKEIGLQGVHTLPFTSWLYALPLGLPVLINGRLGHIHTVPWTNIVELICASICEEILFRGFLVTGLKKHHKLLITLTSSALFALYHLVNIQHASPSYVLLQMVFAFSVGMAYSAYRIRCGTLIPCILFHILTNLTSAAPYTPGSADVLLYGMCSAGCVVYSLYLSFCKRMN